MLTLTYKQSIGQTAGERRRNKDLVCHPWVKALPGSDISKEPPALGGAEYKAPCEVTVWRNTLAHGCHAKLIPLESGFTGQDRTSEKLVP